MYRKIMLFAGACVMSAMLLSGCSGKLEDDMNTYLRPGLVEYEMPEDLERQAAVEAENTVRKLAEQENVPPSLSDDFMQRYLDMSSFEELKQRTLEGIQITNDMADMTSAQINLWQQIIRDEAFNFYTTDDLAARSAELNGILDSIAASHQMTTQEFLASGDFGIDLSGAREFLDNQAAKYATGFEASRSAAPDINFQTSGQEGAVQGTQGSRTAQRTEGETSGGMDDRTVYTGNGRGETVS